MTLTFMNKRLFLFIFTFAGSSISLFANSIAWYNPNGGDFQVAANWNPSTVPGTGDTAIFGSTPATSQGMTVYFDSSVTNTAVDVQNGPLTLIVSNNTYTVTQSLSSGLSMIVGDVFPPTAQPGNANLTLYSGTISAQAVGIGVGGTGSLTVNDGATLNNADTMSVGGGVNQTGTLIIAKGGTVNSTNTSSVNAIGNDSGSSGTVLIPGGTWTSNSTLYVGAQGTGTMTVSNGGTGSNVGVLAIGAYPGDEGELRLSDTGTTWSSTATTGAGQVNVGDGGNGTLVVTNNATLSSQKGNSGSGSSGIVGYAGGVGFATVSGGGSWTQNGALRVGDGSTSVGTLNITSGGTVTSTSGSINYLQGTGTVLVSGTGSSWNAGSALDIGQTGIGSLTLESGGSVTATTVTVYSNGLLQSAGGTVTGNLVNNGGVILGDAPGNLTVNGSYTNNGTLTFLIASASDYSQLFIDGAGSAGDFTGTIDFDFIDGFAPTTGETFDFIEGENGGTIGVFAPISENYSGLAPGYTYSVDYTPGPGGSVDFVSDSNGIATSTPEPGSFLLAGVGITALCLLRRKFRAYGHVCTPKTHGSEIAIRRYC